MMEMFKNNKAGSTAVFCFFLFLFLIKGYGAQVLYVDIADDPTGSYRILEAACRFYGLETVQLILKQDSPQDIEVSLFENDELKAAVITADSLRGIEDKAFISMLSHLQEFRIPLMITEVSPDTDSKLLQKLSDNKISGTAKASDLSARSVIKIGDQKTYARQMAGLESAFENKETNYFRLDDPDGVESVIYITDERNENGFPVFIEISVKGQEIFFLACGQISESSSFSQSLLPVMMFLRRACGPYCWHSSNRFANFTVDDPWLVEPYGHLSFKGLLQEMGNADFHMTLGFIPWNYDRSKSDVVDLFKRNPYKFSLCIHGNNHDHYEFYKYEASSGDPWPAKPLDVQEFNIRQALARMERFRELTGLDFHKVMVFPLGIAPEKTLCLLKKYHFMATVNDPHVPLGSKKPDDPLFDLRTVTLEYADFPSFRRYTPERSKFEIALDLFLDNPLFFYAHHDYFKKGMDAFNDTAQIVNRLQPDITWQSLGTICRRYYLERLRDDGNYEVKAFTNHFIVENRQEKDLFYYIQKHEDFSIPIKKITINGTDASYERGDEKLILKVEIPGGESCEIFIEYENDLEIESMDISKEDPRVNRLRRISDFRDITLSKNFLGRFVINVYYDTGLYKWGITRLTVVLLLVTLIVVFLVWRFIRYRRRKKQPDF
jgi:hypothetical protein